MRNIAIINQDIETCQNQIAAMFDKPFNKSTLEEDSIVKKGFQKNLKKLLIEKDLYIRNIKVHQVITLCPN